MTNEIEILNSIDISLKAINFGLKLMFISMGIIGALLIGAIIEGKR